MAVTLADLDTPFATLGRARVRRLKKHLANLVGPLRLREKCRYSTKRILRMLHGAARSLASAAAWNTEP
jgi:hypothetical protein